MTNTVIIIYNFSDFSFASVIPLISFINIEACFLSSRQDGTLWQKKLTYCLLIVNDRIDLADVHLCVVNTLRVTLLTFISFITGRLFQS